MFVDLSDGEDNASSSVDIMIERRLYGRNEYAAPSNVSGLC
jgi:hypothetical protein